MPNLTINVDELLIKQARIRAIQQGTSLSAKVREFLASYAGGTSQRVWGDPTVDLLRMIDDVRREAQENAEIDAVQPSIPSRPRTLREELYEGDYRTRDRIEDAWRKRPDETA